MLQSKEEWQVADQASEHARKRKTRRLESEDLISWSQGSTRSDPS